MSASGESYFDRARNVNEQLQGMEHDFLSALADHYSPKAEGEQPQALAAEDSSDQLSIGGSSGGRGGDTTRAMVHIRASEDVANLYADAVLRWRMFGDGQSASFLIDLAETIVKELLTEGIVHFGWDSGEEQH